MMTPYRALSGELASDALSGEISLDMTQDRENGLPAADRDRHRLSQLAGVVLDHRLLAFVHNVTTAAPGPGQPCAVTDVTGQGVTSNPASANCYDDRYIGADGSNEGTAPAFSETDLWGLAATFTYELSDTLTLKSISALRSLDSEFARDGDHSPQRISQFHDDLDQDQFSQELQLLGTADRLDWIAGIYYFNEDGNNVNTLDFTVSNAPANLSITKPGRYLPSDLRSQRCSSDVGGRYADERRRLRGSIIYQNYYAGNNGASRRPVGKTNAPFLQAGERILPLLKGT